MGTVFLIFLLLVLCGFIAYVGDLLGRRFGKKRLSIFGMRPKHTAIVLTIATGVLIAAVTFSVALASVPGFREVVTQGEKLSNHNRRLASNNRQLESDIETRKRDNTQLEARNTELSGTTERLEREKGRLTKTNTRLGGENDRLGKQNRVFQSQNARLKGQNQGLESENRALSGTNRTLTSTNTGLTSRNKALLAAQAGLQGQIAILKKDEATYRKIVRDYKEAAYVFRRDDEIERRVVPANAPEDLLRETVTNLIYAANERARRVNNLDEESRVRLVHLVPHQQHPAGMTSDQERLAQWAVQQALSYRNAPVVVRMVADENCVRGRPIPARLECYSNVPVFRKDEPIAQTRIAVLETTPQRPQLMVLGRILADLVYFLQKEVGPAATAPPHAMIPSDQTVGELGYDELLLVCERIYEIGSTGRTVRVVARARQETLRAGPLLLWLDVEPQRTAQDR